MLLDAPPWLPRCSCPSTSHAAAHPSLVPFHGACRQCVLRKRIQAG